MKRFSKFLMAWLLMAALVLAGCNNALSTQIGQTGTIKGKAVYSNGDSNAGINIVVEKLVGGRSVALDDENAVAYQTVTGADGSYEIYGVEPGVYTIYAKSAVSVEGAAAREVEVRAGESLTVADLLLTAVGSIKGKALHNDNGEQGLLVYIAGTSYSAKTDYEGNYEITGVPAGNEYILVVETANGECSVVAANAVKVEAGKAVDAEDLVVWGTASIKHVSARAVDGGILFDVSIPSYASNASTTMSLNVTDSSVGNGIQYTWDMTSGTLSHSFVYPFVEKDKWYTFTVWYGDYSYRVFEERISVFATNGWGEPTVENADKVNLHIEKNEKDSIVVKVDVAPELANIDQPYSLSLNYQINTQTSTGNYKKWLYGPTYAIADERAMEFDIFGGDTYIEGSYGGWRDAGYMKGHMWGNRFNVSLSARITLPNCFGYYTIPVSSVQETAKGEPVKVTVDYSKGYAVYNSRGYTQVLDFDEYEKELEEEKKDLDEALKDGRITQEEYTKRLQSYNSSIERMKAIKDSSEGVPEKATIYYGDMTAEPNVAPKFDFSYEDDNGDGNTVTMVPPAEFVGWVDSNGNKVAFVDEVVPTDRKYFGITDSNPLEEYKIYPAFAMKSIKVKFETNGGSKVYGRLVNPSDYLNPETPTKEDCKFGGWYFDSEFKKPFEGDVEPEDYYSGECNFEVTLYAKWLSEVTVTFETDGGTTLESMKVWQDESFTPPTPEKEGFVFEGWYLDDEYTTPFAGSVDNEATLYVKWINIADIVDQILVQNGDAKGELAIGNGWTICTTEEEDGILGGIGLSCSPTDTDNRKSVTLTVTDCSYISFNFKTFRPTDYGNGWLYFYIDGERYASWDCYYGDYWRDYSYYPSSGEHTFSWEFYKSYGDAVCAMLDNIVIDGEKFVEPEPEEPGEEPVPEPEEPGEEPVPEDPEEPVPEPEEPTEE